MAHIHFGQTAVNGGIFLWLCGSAAAPGPAGTPTCPANGGTVSRTVSAADIQSITGQNLNAGDFAGALRVLRSGDALRERPHRQLRRRRDSRPGENQQSGVSDLPAGGELRRQASFRGGYDL